MRKFILFLIFTFLLSFSVNAQTYRAWRNRTHATDCTSLTDGKQSDLCYEEDDQKLYKCEPTVAGESCDTTAEWKIAGDGVENLSDFFITNETPTPATDGAQTIFTVANAYVSGTLIVMVDGLTQLVTTDYSETSSTTFTMVVAPISDENLRVHYIKQ